MKKILFFVLSICILSFASFGQSKLKLSLFDKSQISVSVDGRHFQKVGTSITVGDLPEGKHWVQIFQISNTRWGRGYEAIIFQGKIKTYRGRITVFEYDREADTANEYDEDLNTYANQNNNNNWKQSTVPNVDYNKNPDNIEDHVYPSKNMSSASSLTDDKMNNLKTKIDAQKTETEKLSNIKNELNAETMTTAQISKMMDWFSFESSKVDFAKWAFEKTLDNNNYGSLEAKLTYKEYIEDLDNYINNK